MATYAYKCSACGQAFDLKATIQEKEEGKKFACLKCGSKDIKQEFSAANFIKNIFKGENKNENFCSNENAGDREPTNPENDRDEDKKDSCGCGCGCS